MPATGAQQQKIRLGAPDEMVLFDGLANVTDLGISMGGAELVYTPTVALIEVDQAIAPVKAYRTKEELMFSVVLAQFDPNIISAAFAYNYAGAPNVTALTAIPAVSTTTTSPLPAGTPVTALAVTALTGDIPAFSRINLPGFYLLTTADSPAAATSIPVQSFTPAVTVASGVAVTYTGVAHTNRFTFGSEVTVAQGTFDWSAPKNDGTGLHLRGHINLCVSAKATKIDFMREKATELNRVELSAMADLTQPIGQTLGWLEEELAV